MPITAESPVLQTFTNGDVQALFERRDRVNDRFPASTEHPFTGATLHGDITPLIMKMNQYRDWNHPLVQELLRLGADPTMVIDYYGRPRSALDIFGPP